MNDPFDIFCEKWQREADLEDLAEETGLTEDEREANAAEQNADADRDEGRDE